MVKSKNDGMQHKNEKLTKKIEIVEVKEGPYFLKY
jgi:hypothetical protein